MRAPIYQVDAFTTELFAGNPAAVVPLEAWPADALLQGIARENNLSETAFLVASKAPDADYELRWFTPTVEVALCGHATLASGHVLMRHLGFDAERVRFATRRSGIVGVEREGGREGGRLVLDFPAIEPVKPRAGIDGLEEALGAPIGEVWVADRGASSEGNVVAILGSAAAVRGLAPDFRRLRGIGGGCVTVTAPGDGAGVDFVSRFFAPGAGIDEDPVTGSAHCILTPLWGARLGKRELHARQVSERGGELWCTLAGDRVRIGGHAVTYMEGTIEMPPVARAAAS